MQMYAPLVIWDWLVIGAFFAIVLGIGLYFSRRATGSMTEYFVAGRKMTWWLAGTSIVATSFAADTPLVIAGWMRNLGLERNWFWWGGIMGMMLCAFFFARLWRRAKIITDIEFNEIRYHGKPAAFLRGFHASYRSLIQNTLVMGWVTLAMTKILEVTLNIPTLVFVHGSFLPELVAKGVEVSSVIDITDITMWPIVGEAIIPAKVTGIIMCMGVAAIYTTISGIWGVMTTDFFQFTFAMTGVIILMIVAFIVAGGPTKMVIKAKQAVKDGIVVNQPITHRIDVNDKELLQSVGIKFDDKDDLQSLIKGSDKIKSLINTGLVAWSPEKGTLEWAANGMDENEISGILAASQVEDKAKALTLWQNAYLADAGHFTDFTAIDKAVAAGILKKVKENDANSYQFININITDDELRSELTKAGVENKGEIVAAYHYDRVVPPRKITSFLPPFDLQGGGLVAIWSIIVFLGLQWWAGGEGGGFLAQRLFSCKNEKHSVLAMLWFNLANYVLRPWPWIVVGVASIFLIPDITAYGAGYDAEHAYVVMLMKFMPVGLKGMMVAALMAAYMSTIASHVNFGASYVVNDLYKRFIYKKGTDRSNVIVSQIASICLAFLAALYAYYSSNIGTSWMIYFELMSGAGIVVLLRWYWWRISAWTEISAMASSLGMYALLNFTHVFHGIFEFFGLPSYLLDEYAVRFSINMFCSAIVWLAVTFIAPTEPEKHLVGFYNRIKPAGWWKKVALDAGNPHHLHVGKVEWACWGLGVTGLFAMIFCLGKLCFGQYVHAIGFGAYAAVATFLIFILLPKMDWSGMAEQDKSPE